MAVIRQFDVFDKLTEELKNEIVIENLDIEAVRSLVDLIKEDPKLYGAYPVNGVLQDYFENLGYFFDMEKYDYFLVCYQDN